MRLEEPISYFAETNFRNQHIRFGIKREDRFSHIYIIGKTGTGKSTLIENLASQDLDAGRGFALIDPHGDLALRLLEHATPEQRGSIIYLDAADPVSAYGYNPLRHVRPEFVPLAAAGLLEILKKMWSDAWGVRMEHILRNAILALLEQDEANLADILRLFSDKTYRQQVARRVSNPIVQRFWKNEFANYSYAYRADGAASIQNKIGALLADPRLRRILTEAPNELRLRRLMDSHQILIVNLAKGRLGEDSASLLGGMLVTALGLAAFSRADQPPSERQDFFVYIDEFQSFTTLALVNMLSELRKYRVGFTIAHQYLHQLDPDIRHAVLGNAGTVISFRLGAEDAPYLSREFEEHFPAADLLRLSNYDIFLKLMIDGTPSRPFSATTLSQGNCSARSL